MVDMINATIMIKQILGRLPVGITQKISCENWYLSE